MQPNIVTWSYLDADITTFGVTGFMVQRKQESCAGTGAYAQVATVPATARSYTDADLIPGATYCYRVVALSAAGNSSPSNSAEKTVQSLPPAPASLSVS